MKATLGPALRLLRLQRGLAIRDVARRIDSWPASYSRYEQGDVDIRCATLGRILDAMGAQLNELAVAVIFARSMGLSTAPCRASTEGPGEEGGVCEESASCEESGVGSDAWWRQVAAQWRALWRQGGLRKRTASSRGAGRRRAPRAPGTDLDQPELVGHALRLLRLRQGLEIEELAGRLDMYPQQLGAYEKGTRGMLVATLAQILQSLGYTWVDLQEMLVLARHLYRRRDNAPSGRRQPRTRLSRQNRSAVPVDSDEWRRRLRLAEQEIALLTQTREPGATGVRQALFALGCRIWPTESEFRIASALRAVAASSSLFPSAPRDASTRGRGAGAGRA